MARKTRNPGAGRRQGFDLELVSQAGSSVEATALPFAFQDAVAAQRIARRFNLTPSTAALVVELSGIGGAHA